MSSSTRKESKCGFATVETIKTKGTEDEHHLVYVLDDDAEIDVGLMAHPTMEGVMVPAISLTFTHTTGGKLKRTLTLASPVAMLKFGGAFGEAMAAVTFATHMARVNGTDLYEEAKAMQREAEEEPSEETTHKVN